MATLSRIVLVVAVCGLLAGCGRQQGEHRNRQQGQAGNAATATQQVPMGQPLHVRRICAADIQKFCATDPRPRPCLRAHLTELSDACKNVMMEARERHRQRMLDRTQDQNPQGLVTPNKPQQNQTTVPTQPTPQGQTPPKSTTNNNGDDGD